MSSRVTVRAASLRELISKLQDVRGYIRIREAEGWAPFQPDERWRYESMRDVRVCPVCRGYQVRHILSGPEMVEEFHGKARYDGGFVALPNTHRAYPWLKRECRCLAYLENPERTLALRLAGELREVVK